jgi:Flp pilus assembly protein TadG
MTSRAQRGYLAERGSVSVFTVFFTIIVIFLAAMLVDLGDVMNSRERAADIAEQAARAAAEAINVQELRAGSGPVVIDQSEAAANAEQLVQDYASPGSGINATLDPPVRFPSAREATVTVTVTTTPIFTGIFGGSFTETVTESACAEPGITTGEPCPNGVVG